MHFLMDSSASSSPKEPEKAKFRAIELGCGDSRAAEGVAATKKFKYVVGVDLTPELIKMLSKHHYDEKTLEYKVMDVTKLDFKDGFFDLAIDKATADSVRCGPLGIQGVKAMLKEAHRVLGPLGVYVMLTCHEDSKEKLFDNKLWEIKSFVEQKNFVKAKIAGKDITSCEDSITEKKLEKDNGTDNRRPRKFVLIIAQKRSQ